MKHERPITIPITPTTAARLTSAYSTVLSPVCITGSQALSTPPVIQELGEQEPEHVLRLAPAQA